MTAANVTAEKSLDRKLARILADPSCADFILADAKDADMAYGLAAPGQSPEHHGAEGRFRSLEQYRDLIRTNVRQGLVDIMLMSVSTSELLTIHERLFDGSAVTPAIRANDTTDIHLAAGSRYAAEPSRPFRSATIDHAMCGKVACAPAERRLGADLGLYSLTFNNDVELDLDTLEHYKAFRLEAEAKGFRHFLELFNPNAPRAPIPDVARFLNDQIARTLAGVPRRGRPIFLKIPYHGPAAMEALASYDRTLIPGILGGSAGTTFDAFHQLWEARRHGARAALYGRMINHSEHQPTFIQHLRWLADGDLDDPAEAVRSYHAALEKLGLRPYRALDEDLRPTGRGSGYGESGGNSKPKPVATTVTASGTERRADATAPRREPDFASMSPAERVAWNLNRWRRVLD